MPFTLPPGQPPKGITVTDPTDLLLLVAALAEQGFYRSGERLVAANGTLWLSRPMLDYCGIDGLRIEAKKLLSRKLRQRKSFESEYDWQRAVEDIEGLMVALDEIPRREELEPLAEAS